MSRGDETRVLPHLPSTTPRGLTLATFRYAHARTYLRDAHREQPNSKEVRAALKRLGAERREADAEERKVAKRMMEKMGGADKLGELGREMKEQLREKGRSPLERPCCGFCGAQQRSSLALLVGAVLAAIAAAVAAS